MAENKTDELKKQTMEAADQAEEKVKEGVGKVEHSKAGQYIPTHIEKVEFKSIIYATIVMNFLTTLPIYLMFSLTDDKAATAHAMKYIYLFLFTFCGLVAPFFDALTIAMKLELLVKGLMLLKIIKGVCLVISPFLLSFKLKIATGLFIVYLFGVAFLDLVFVYYTVLYFDRLRSEHFDDNGNPKENV